LVKTLFEIAVAFNLDVKELTTNTIYIYRFHALLVFNTFK